SGASDTGTVTVGLTGCVWYVNNNDADGLDLGTSAAPFAQTDLAELFSEVGHVIFVYEGDGTTLGYDSGLHLQPDQQLIGEASDLVVDGATLHAGDPDKRPTLTVSSGRVVHLA